MKIHSIVTLITCPIEHNCQQIAPTPVTVTLITNLTYHSIRYRRANASVSHAPKPRPASNNLPI